MVKSCILLGIYIKPQHSITKLFHETSCILLGIYIKPQLASVLRSLLSVVSYWESTSNHNRSIVSSILFVLYFIGNLHQTTTRLVTNTYQLLLYLIGNLHQTTTYLCFFVGYFLLYLIGNLHQTTTCTLSQLVNRQLYLIGNLHQTTTIGRFSNIVLCCILLGIYIKPQLPV